MNEICDEESNLVCSTCLVMYASVLPSNKSNWLLLAVFIKSTGNYSIVQVVSSVCATTTFAV